MHSFLEQERKVGEEVVAKLEIVASEAVIAPVLNSCRSSRTGRTKSGNLTSRSGYGRVVMMSKPRRSQR